MLTFNLKKEWFEKRERKRIIAIIKAHLQAYKQVKKEALTSCTSELMCGAIMASETILKEIGEVIND